MYLHNLLLYSSYLNTNLSILPNPITSPLVTTKHIVNHARVTQDPACQFYQFCGHALHCTNHIIYHQYHINIGHEDLNNQSFITALRVPILFMMDIYKCILHVMMPHHHNLV